MHYTAEIVSKGKQKMLFGKCLHFYQGFVNEPRIDWWNILEQYFGQPVVSVRQSGRPSWDEIIVLLADGSIATDGKCLLDYDSETDLESVLSDIFREAENDEYEMFESYMPGPKCSNDVWTAVVNWVREAY